MFSAFQWRPMPSVHTAFSWRRTPFLFCSASLRIIETAFTNDSHMSYQNENHIKLYPLKVSSCRVSFCNQNNTDRADLHICRLPLGEKALTPIPSYSLVCPSADYSAGIFSLQSNYPQKNCGSCEPKSIYICDFNSQPSVAFLLPSCLILIYENRIG